MVLLSCPSILSSLNKLENYKLNTNMPKSMRTHAHTCTCVHTHTHTHTQMVHTLLTVGFFSEWITALYPQISKIRQEKKRYEIGPGKEWERITHTHTHQIACIRTRALSHTHMHAHINTHTYKHTQMAKKWQMD